MKIYLLNATKVVKLNNLNLQFTDSDSLWVQKCGRIRILSFYDKQNTLIYRTFEVSPSIIHKSYFSSNKMNIDIKAGNLNKSGLFMDQNPNLESTIYIAESDCPKKT